MSNFALGLTKTAVEGTLSRVQLAIDEQNRLRVTAKQDLRYITAEFQMMQSFLKVVNKERANNEVVKTWVRQLRDLAFDVEDCVEFVFHLDNNNSALIWLWRLVPSCMAPPQTRDLDKAVAELKQLKARVEEVSQRNTRYNLISDSGSQTKTTTPTEQAALVTTNPSAFHMLTEVWEAAGKRRGMSDLQELIMGEGSDLQTISVWGSSVADLGTTSIFSMLYSDPGICRAFKRRAWVKLTHPIKPDEFIKSLLAQFYVSSHQKNIAMDHLTEAELMQQVKAHKYLIILEEVFSVVDWDAIRVCLPDYENGSRIIVSTKQLRTALLCTGGTYQVSELRRSSDDQSLCAFSKKVGRHGGMRDLIWQIRCRGVISVWGLNDGKSAVINKVYTSIVHKCKQFDGLEFERHSWVDVPDPFNLKVFSRRLLVSFRSEDLQAEEIAVVGMMEEPGLTQECCKFLREDDCLVVINDLQSTHDWDLIKAAFLSEPIKGCILIITDESNVSTHCVEDKYGVLNIKELEADTMLRPLIKGCQYYGIGGKEATHSGRLFSIRLGETREWFTKFQHIYCEEVHEIWSNLEKYDVTSLWGHAGVGKSTIARLVYYNLMLRSDASWEWEYQERPVHTHEKIKMFSWVDVPHPFNLKDFFWRLLLDFHSDDLRAKKIAAVSMMEGQDPIQVCSKFLREGICVVVIDGLRSTDDWDLIKAALLSDPVSSHIIVITDVASVATHCVDKRGRVMKVNCVEADVALGPPIKDCASRIFSNRRAEAHDLVNTFTLLGHQNQSAVELRRSLASSGPSVSSLWGIAGVGKSVLVRSLYCHLLLGLNQYFKFGTGYNLANPRTEFTMCSWVDVLHPFSLTDLSWHLLLDFHSDDLQAKEKAAIGIIEGQDPVQECRRILCEYRSLVVIDGLRSREDWDLIKAAFLPDSTNACIIIITNEATVATHCVDKEDRAVNVKGLDADTALSLFKKITWDGKELTPDEMELSKVTIGRCGGIPKVIATIGQLFAKKIANGGYYWRMPTSSTNLLKGINDDFMGKLETDQGFRCLRGLFSWMQSYFDGCSDSLKPCIFYLSIFPPEHKITQRHLLRRWIAEGYCRDTASDTAEENGKRLFLELISLSIIQQCQKAGKYLYQVNSFFHEYIISRPMEDNLVFALEGNCSPNSQHAGQHLTIREDWDRDIIVFRSMDFSRLRSLTVFGKWMSFFLSSNMSLLRVLDMAHTSGILDGDLEQIVKVLPRLKFLSLRGCKEISHLPESLGGLRQLQTLDVRHTSIVMLPLCIIKLQKLQYIRAGTILSSDEGDDSVASIPTTNVDQMSTPPEGSDDMVITLPDQAEEVQTSTLLSWSCRPRNLVSRWLSKLPTRRLDNDGIEIPVGIGSLTALHTIGVVNVNIRIGKAILKDLKNLTQLRKLGVSGINSQNIQELCNFISGHSHLKSLSVQLDKDKEGLFACFGDMISQPPKTLKSFKLYGHVNKLPIWIKQLHNLEKFNLELTILLQEDMNILGELPDTYCLRRLCVKPVQDGELNFSTLRGHIYLGSLRVLEINCISKLQITFVSVALYGLQVLKINFSGEASSQISGLEHLLELKEVWLKGSYGDKLKQELQQQLSEHANKPVLKLVQGCSS